MNLDQFILLWGKDHLYCGPESFCPQAGLALPCLRQAGFSNRLKGSKNLVKTNPPPGVLTAHARASVKGWPPIERLIF
jgi:hypothetical protein